MKSLQTKESVASKLHKLDSKQDRIGQVPRHDVQQHNGNLT